MKELPKRFSVYASSKEEGEYIIQKQNELKGKRCLLNAQSNCYYRFWLDVNDTFGTSHYSYLDDGSTKEYTTPIEMTFAEFKEYFEPDLLTIASLNVNDCIHCSTKEEYDTIQSLIKAAGLSCTRSNAFSYYGSDTVLFPSYSQYGDLEFVNKNKQYTLFKASQFIKQTMSTTQIKRGDLRKLYHQFECNDWKTRIRKYLETTFLEADDFLVTINETDLTYAEEKVTTAQRNALKEVGLEFAQLFRANDLATNEILEVTDTARGDVKYVIKSRTGYIYVYNNGYTNVTDSSVLKGKRLPKGTKIEIVAE